MFRTVDDPILEIKNLKTYFFLERGTVYAVNGVSLSLARNSTLGIVGESGCGKSVTARSVMRLVQSPPGRIVEGEILLHRKSGSGRRGGDVVDLAKVDPKGQTIREIRGGEIAMIFQEPMTSLNPLQTVGNQIAESVELHQKVSKNEALNRAQEMLEAVQISDAGTRLKQYPHQLSGGMRQRVMIALAMSCNPSILIADEPTTALDVTVQAQILELMEKLQADFDSAIMLITHNLGVVSQTADHVAVMYLGRVVEYSETRAIFHEPLHPYTEGLLSSVPVLGRKTGALNPIEGMVPSPTSEIQGCPFASRCPKRIEICDEQRPELKEHKPGHWAACWLHE
ncbi:MAG: ABC transporter ATP-binding protein [Chloroflexota bacterium]